MSIYAANTCRLYNQTAKIYLTNNTQYVGNVFLRDEQVDLVKIENFKLLNFIILTRSNTSLFIYYPQQLESLKGLTNYWPIAGSLRDIIGGMDMQLDPKLNSQLYWDQFGIANSSLLLNKAYGLLPPNVYFDPATNGFTVLVWIYLISFQNQQRVYEFSTQNTEMILLYFSGTSNSLKSEIYSGTSCSSCLFTKTSIQLYTWYHLGVTVNSTHHIVYLNGAQIASINGGTYSNVVRSFCSFGRSSYYTNEASGTDQDLNGLLDEIKIFNRSLSPAEILADLRHVQPYKVINTNLFYTFKPPVTYTNGLTNYWPLNGNGMDVVGGNNLTLVGIQFGLDKLGNPNSALYLLENIGYSVLSGGLSFDSSVGLTIMFWINFNNIFGYSMIFSFSNNQKYNLIKFHYNSYYIPFGYCFYSPLISNCFPTSITISTWTHLAISLNSTYLMLYINGIGNQIQLSSNGGTSSIDSLLQIGASGALNAAIDEFKIFSRSLSSTDVTSEMNKYIRSNI